MSLRKSDLEELVLPLLSIDEYETKIGDDKDIVVVGMFVRDEEPASDLARFIDNSPHEILDTDVSPAPTQEGYYVVFIEVYRNPEFPKIMVNITDELEILTDIKEWQFKVYKQDEIYPLTAENLAKQVRLEDKIHEHFEVRRYLRETLLDSVDFHNQFVTIAKRNSEMTFKIIKMAETKDVELKSSLIFENLATERRLASMLGPKWLVNIDGHKCILTNKSQNKHSLVLRIT